MEPLESSQSLTRGNHGQGATDQEAEFKDRESLSRSTKNRRKWAGRRKGTTDKGIKGRGHLWRRSDQTEERPAVSDCP